MAQEVRNVSQTFNLQAQKMVVIEGKLREMKC